MQRVVWDLGEEEAPTWHYTGQLLSKGEVRVACKQATDRTKPQKILECPQWKSLEVCERDPPKQHPKNKRPGLKFEVQPGNRVHFEPRQVNGVLKLTETQY